MYYLWRDKYNTDKYYVTDYNEQQPDGRVWIDGFGLTECTLEFEHKEKMKCWEFAQLQFMTGTNFCPLCKQISDPSLHHGCDRDKERGCLWFKK